VGAWGTAVFSDDSALDSLEALVSAKSPTNYMREAFDAALASKYLEYDAAHAVLVSAAVMDTILNGASHADNPESLELWLSDNAGLDVAALKPLAKAAIARVLSKDSELEELWRENVGDYPAWRAGIEAISGRLNA
jgi:Domain of unknown function (DUF4259)